MNRWVLVALAFAAMASPAAAINDVLPTIEASCTGGVAGVYQFVSVTPDGEIRATNGFAERPWPIVGTDLAAASNWFATLAATGSAEPVIPNDDAPIVMDALNCALSVSGDGKVIEYNQPDVHRAIMTWLPER